MAENAYRLLDEWKTPPGTQEKGAFNAEQFEKWVRRVKELCTESGHLEVALRHIGKVLIYAPEDPGRLWIHSSVASALDERDDEDIRIGFYQGIFNSRGAHQVDSTAKPEKELAEQFHRKAEELKKICLPQFAATLERLSDYYEEEAKRIIDEHSQRPRSD